MVIILFVNLTETFRVEQPSLTEGSDIWASECSYLQTGQDLGSKLISRDSGVQHRCNIAFPSNIKYGKEP